MIEVADYREDGFKLIVRLKCTCGGHRMLKIDEGGMEAYKCAGCGSKATLRSLKEDSTSIWQSHMWEVVAEKPSPDQ